MGMFSDLKKLNENQQDEQPLTPEKNTTPTPLPHANTNKAVEKSNCQLNAWITGEQNKLLDQIYFRLRSNNVKIKKGELIGIAIEILSRILENQNPSPLDSTVLDRYIQETAKKT